MITPCSRQLAASTMHQPTMSDCDDDDDENDDNSIRSLVSHPAS